MAAKPIKTRSWPRMSQSLTGNWQYSMLGTTEADQCCTSAGASHPRFCVVSASLQVPYLLLQQQAPTACCPTVSSWCVCRLSYAALSQTASSQSLMLSACHFADPVTCGNGESGPPKHHHRRCIVAHRDPPTSLQLQPN